MQTFSGEKLAELRRRKRLTQTDLALALRTRGYGTTQTQVSRWEADQEPRHYIRSALADALSAKVEEMYVDEDDKDEEPDMATALRRLAALQAEQATVAQRIQELAYDGSRS